MGSNSCFLPRVLFSLVLFLFLESVDLKVEGSCPTDCGGVKIMYPFGVGEGCYMEKWYEIVCQTSTSAKGVPFLSVINKEVVNISLRSYDGGFLPSGSIRIRNQITSKGCSNDGEEGFESLLNLTGTPFHVSEGNTLIAVGCNTKASLTNVEPGIVGCKSSCRTEDHTPTKDYLALLNCLYTYGYEDYYCDYKQTSDGPSCNGDKCCTALMPDRIQQIVGVQIDNNTTTTGCKVAFLLDPYEAYSLSNADPQKFHAERYSTVELRWFIHTSNLSKLTSLGCSNIKSFVNLVPEQRKLSRCVCDYNAFLSYARCSCNRGYEGNPYVLDGCKDIDECQLKNSCGLWVNKSCGDSETCVNLEGSYNCVHTNHRPLVIGFSTSFGSAIFVTVMYWLYKIVRIQRKLNQKRKFFKRNGGLLLQQQLTSTEGNVEKTKMFSSQELEKATENFSSNRILGQGGQGTVYKGMLVDGRIVAVKKSKVVDEDNLEEFINEVVILSQINHRNIVKLLGCCLETNVPVLVYEFISNGNLSDYLHNNEFDDNIMATWEVRLRIAIDIAGALSYLHSSASSPIYHRDVKTTNIMLDEKYRAKVSDFGTSRSVTVDHTHLTTVVSGTMGYMDPEYFQSSQYTDKSDVYSFGVVLAELITGQRSISYLRSQENRTLATYFTLAVKENKLFDIIDVRIRDNCMLDQVIATAKVARKCLSLKGKKRPSMREVSMELDKIRLLSGDTQLHENFSDKEEEDIDKGAVQDNTGPIELLDNTFLTAPASQYEIVAASSSSWSESEPLFPHKTR